MGCLGGKLVSSVCKAVKVSGLSSSSSSSSSNSSNSAHRKGERKDIDIDENDLNDTIKMISRIEIPAENNKYAQKGFNFFGKLFVGSKFTHDGLLIETNSNKYFICQTYPIQFKKCNNYKDAIEEIKSYWQINNNAIHNQNGQYVYDNITIKKIKNIVENLPNYYDLFTYNCQHFCTKILRRIGIYSI